MRALILCLPLCLGLAACGLDTHSETPKTDEKGTSLSVLAKDDSGQDVGIKTDANSGEVSVNLPGVDARVALPKIVLKDSNFDLDGVRLYPGSSISAINVVANSAATAGQSQVKVVFAAPASPDTVRAWFAKAFADHGLTATAKGTGLTGTTRDGDGFTMAFAPAEAGTTTGTILIADRN